MGASCTRIKVPPRPSKPAGQEARYQFHLHLRAGIHGQIADERYPVTLYTFPCGALPERGVTAQPRGVPFTIIDSAYRMEATRLPAVASEGVAPVLQVGDKQVAKGFNEDRWQSLLDEAGYPKTPPPRKAAPVGRVSERAQPVRPTNEAAKADTPKPASKQVPGAGLSGQLTKARPERPMIVATWNVNSLNVRLPRLLEWLAARRSRTSCACRKRSSRTTSFPSTSRARAGYTAHFAGQRTYNGVGLLARDGLTGDRHRAGCPASTTTQKRVIAATIAGMRVIDVYVPQRPVGRLRQVSLQARLVRGRGRLAARRTVAPRESRGARRLQRRAGRPRRARSGAVGGAGAVHRTRARRVPRIRSRLGLKDSFRLFEQPDKTFSWWDYRQLAFPKNHGLRIDHILLSAPLAARCTACRIDRNERKGEKPSDHAPVMVELRDAECAAAKPPDGLRFADLPVPVPAADAGGVLRVPRIVAQRRAAGREPRVLRLGRGALPAAHRRLGRVNWAWASRSAAAPTAAAASAGSPSPSPGIWRRWRVQVREFRGAPTSTRSRRCLRGCRRSRCAADRAAARHLVLHVPRDLVRRRRVQAQRRRRAQRARDFALYILLFPQLIAGPDHPLSRHRRTASRRATSASRTSRTASAASSSGSARRC